MSAATGPGDPGAVTPAQLLAGLLLAIVVLWLLAPFAGNDPPAGLTASNAPWTDEGFNLANARERVLSGRFATGDVDRSLTNGAYSALAAATFAVTGPSLAAGRALSMIAVAAAVLLLALGLTRPLGRPAALLAAVALGGANLVLEHGRLALVEAVVVALLTGAFVLATRAAWRPSAAAGTGVGLLVALAVSVKANALLPGLVMLGVVLVAAAARRDRAALAMGLAGLGTLVLAAAGWLIAIALPNWDRFRTALRIWPTVHYLDSPVVVADRLGRYLADSDQALSRSLPLLLAAALGVAALVRRWPRLEPAARDALVMAGLWGAGLWLAVVVGDYLPGHYIAPNRYIVVAVPGVVVYLNGAMDSGRGRELGQWALAATLPRGSVVYGAYAPTLLFDTRLVTRAPWPTADANIRDPVGRLGVTHLLVGQPPADPTGQVVAVPRRGTGLALARVRWGHAEVLLYSLPFGVSPVASPIDYHPQAGTLRQT